MRMLRAASSDGTAVCLDETRVYFDLSSRPLLSFTDSAAACDANGHDHRYRDPRALSRPAADLLLSLQNRPTVTSIIHTRRFQEFDEAHQRRAAHLAFAFILQLQYTELSGAAQNYFVYGSDYTEESWLQPSMWLWHAALSQWQIIGARTATETFMELVHFLRGNSDFDAALKSLIHEMEG
jgi:hypothetical protein